MANTANVAKVEIYTRLLCSYCARAVDLLGKKGVAYDNIDAGADPQTRQTMRDRAGGANTFPQIFINGQHIGGCDDLYALERAGKLDPLLTGEAG